MLATSADAASVRTESWYDAQHGWAIVDGSIRSTEDGGASWRRIGPRAGGGEAVGVLRTGLSAGVYYAFARGPFPAFWTKDNGRHWTRSKAIGPGAVGSGRFLFWAAGSRLYRVTPWPPTGSPLQAVVVLRLEAGELTAEGVVPGGVIAVSSRSGLPPHAYVLRWLPASRAPVAVDRDLPQGTRALNPCRSYLQDPVVDWPVIVIPACTGATGPVAVWRTTDGGSSWALVGG